MITRVVREVHAIRWFPREWKRIQEAVRRAELSVSEFVRQAALAAAKDVMRGAK